MIPARARVARSPVNSWAFTMINSLFASFLAPVELVNAPFWSVMGDCAWGRIRTQRQVRAEAVIDFRMFEEGPDFMIRLEDKIDFPV